MTDLEKSEIVIAKILALLMDWGIKDTELEFKELELSDDFSPYFFPCVEWLAMEGIIRYREIKRYLGGSSQGFVSTPVLTSFGLSVLGHDFSLGKGKPLAQHVREISEAGPNYTGIGDFFGGILGGFTKSMNS